MPAAILTGPQAYSIGFGIPVALGRMVPWPVSSALFIALVFITLVGGSVRRPDAFPHERAWNRARAVFLAAGVVGIVTCWVALIAIPL